MKKSSIGVLGALSACLLLLCISAQAQMNRLDSPSYLCVCPGDTLMYNCTINGGGSTLWTGRDFDCSSSSDEIILRHSQFSNPDGESGACNNGTIVGRSLTDGSGLIFSSQLSVPVSLSSVGADVCCIYDNGGVMTTVNTSTISLISTPFAEPGNVTLSHANRGLITFSWSPVPSDCPLSYRISSTCGDCPSATNNSTVDCSVTDLSTEDMACEFSVQSVACGSFVSISNRISPKVNAPSVPEILNVLPVYYLNSTLKRVQVQFSESTSFNIYDGVDGSAKEYNISYFVGTSSSSCYSAIVPASSCANGVCNHSFAVSSSCLSSADINVAVFATNVLGNSQTSFPFTTNVVNDFVTVGVNTSTNTINCTFLTGMSSSEKHCSVVYGPCSQTPTQSVSKSVNGSTNTILLRLRFNQQSDYCYTVSASNDDFAVQVEGIVKYDGGSSSNTHIGIIIGVIVLCIIVVIGIIVLVFVICLTGKRKRLTFRSDPNNKVSIQLVPTFKPISQDRNLEKLYVEDASELREFIVKCKGSYKRGCVFYQFINEFESITENQEAIRMKKEDTNKENNCITYYEGHDIVGKGGPKKKRPSDDNYLAFIQCTGPGVRYLPAESYILYEEKADKTDGDLTTSANEKADKTDGDLTTSANDLPEWKSLIHICSDAFKISSVPNGCTLNAFCDSVPIERNKSNIFPEVKHLGDYNLEDVRDVILSEKHHAQKKNSVKLFTGPKARHMLQQYRSDHSFDPKWNMFVVFKKPQGTLQPTEGCLVLYQDPDRYVSEMAVLPVDGKCVQVSNFLESKKSVEAVGDGDIHRLFYEFTGDEDLDSYREVVTATSKDLKQECFKTDWNNYGVQKFYRLQTPGIGVKKPDLSGLNLKMFIQCVQDDLTRCLKPGTVVLYKKHGKSVYGKTP